MSHNYFYFIFGNIFNKFFRKLAPSESVIIKFIIDFLVYLFIMQIKF